MTACTVPTTTPAATAAARVAFPATLLAMSPIMWARSRAVFIIRLARAGAFFAISRPAEVTSSTRRVIDPFALLLLRFAGFFVDDLTLVDLADFFAPDDLDLLADLLAEFFAAVTLLDLLDRLGLFLPLFLAMRILL